VLSLSVFTITIGVQVGGQFLAAEKMPVSQALRHPILALRLLKLVASGWLRTLKQTSDLLFAVELADSRETYPH
jgi:hypothetical protein